MTYMIDNKSGPAHKKRYICVVQIATKYPSHDGMKNLEKNDAENSIASLMLVALKEHNHL